MRERKLQAQHPQLVEASGELVQGYLKEAARDVSGQVTGRISEGRFEGELSAPAFTATISLTSTGRTQVIDIYPRGGVCVPMGRIRWGRAAHPSEMRASVAKAGVANLITAKPCLRPLACAPSLSQSRVSVSTEGE